MEIAAAILATVLLTVAALAISRAGAEDHPEDLDDHDLGVGGRRPDERGRAAQPKADRPAGPDAEAMGVAQPGEPSTDPASQTEGERLAHRG